MPGPDMPGADRAGEIILEFQYMPHAVKVSAIDIASSTEVSIMGPRGASQSELERVARAKLSYVIAKRAKPSGGARYV
jgi:hypothetical protein